MGINKLLLSIILFVMIIPVIYGGTTIWYNFSSTYEGINIWAYHCTAGGAYLTDVKAENLTTVYDVQPSCGSGETEVSSDTDLERADTFRIISDPGSASKNGTYIRFKAKINYSTEQVAMINWTYVGYESSTRDITGYMFNHTLSMYTPFWTMDGGDPGTSYASTYDIDNYLNSTNETYFIVKENCTGGCPSSAEIRTDYVKLEVTYYNPCSISWNESILHGESIVAYRNQTYPCGETCENETRTCNDGTLSGTFTNETCNAVCLDCSLPWGGILPHTQSVTAYYNASVPYGESCSSETRTCTSGILSGTYTSSSCSMETNMNSSFFFDIYSTKFNTATDLPDNICFSLNTGIVCINENISMTSNTYTKIESDSLFYLKTNPYGFYNVSTIPYYYNDTVGWGNLTDVPLLNNITGVGKADNLAVWVNETHLTYNTTSIGDGIGDTHQYTISRPNARETVMSWLI